MTEPPEVQLGSTGAAPYVLTCRSVCKSFHGVPALDGVSIDLRKGEIHGLVGENGAGKSTLIKILGGIYTADTGEIFVGARRESFRSPAEARRKGLAFIHQEPTVFPDLSVAENLFAGSFPRRGLVLLDRRKMQDQARALLTRMDVAVDPGAPIRTIRPAEAQVVEILRALALETPLLVMDEPTSSLGQADKDRLFALLMRIKQHGTTVLYVSHFLDEVLAICDRITVLKDGSVVGTLPAAGLTKQTLIRMMIGREALHEAKGVAAPSEVLLAATDLRRRSGLAGVSFDLHRGEILGVYGLQGSGKTELARALFGLDPVESGTIAIDGHAVRLRNPSDAISRGIGFVTESRQAEGIFASMSVLDNVTATIMDQLVWPWRAIRRRKQREVGISVTGNLKVRFASLQQPIMFLSGGNQQKILLGRWLLKKPRILILDEPTKGIDVGAKFDFYHLLRELAGEGVSVLLISSDAEEVVEVAGRVLIMRHGEMVAEFTGDEVSENRLIDAATAGSLLAHSA